MVLEFPISRGMIALIDSEDLPKVQPKKWHAHKKPKDKVTYAQASFGNKKVQMHRLILGANPGQIVDHIDGNGLNNTKANLRFCTASQNRANSHRRYGASPFRGVSWSKASKKWVAQIWLEGTQRYLGQFDNPVSAAFAYDVEARKKWGEFALPNFAPLPDIWRGK